MTGETSYRSLRDELLPVLLGRIGRLTERLVGAGEAFEGDTEEARRVGWLLGFLSALAGDDLLGSRREPDELELALELVGQWVVSRGTGWALLEVPVLRKEGTTWESSARSVAFVMERVLAAEGLARVRAAFVRGGGSVELELRLEAGTGVCAVDSMTVPAAWLD